MKSTCDLELSITRQDQNAYAVDFRYTDSDPDNQADVRLGAKEQVLAVFDLVALQQSLVLGDLPEYSAALTKSFFADESLRAVFAQARAVAGQANASLRVRLLVASNARELHTLRWELLNDPSSGQKLATDQSIFFSRYLSSADWRAVRLRARGELKALAFIAAPNGLEAHKLAPVDKTVEIATVAKGLGELRLKILEHGTLNEMTAALSAEEFDILYLVAHGQLGSDGEGRLWLEDVQGGIAHVSAIEFVNRLRELEHRPRLVVLASCQSAGAGTGEILAALGPRLAEVGIPAVLAMQGNISMETVAQFMPIFFGELQKDGRIDRALSVARGLIRERPDSSLPALFMRLKSGRLWYTPGESVDGNGFEKFPSLAQNIQEGLCIPIIGPGLTESLLGSPCEIARGWAQKFNYPMMAHQCEELPQVAQFLATKHNPRFPLVELERTIRDRLHNRWGEKSAPENAHKPKPLHDLIKTISAEQRQTHSNDPHILLARLPLPIFITTNADPLLEEALRAVGKSPEGMLCPWNEHIDKQQVGQDKPIFKRDPDYFPTPERPLVFYLFGRWDNPLSLVLTEDDYFKFLMGVTQRRRLIPAPVREILSDSGLLFLGFQTEGWNFRVLLHSILGQGSRRRDLYTNIAAQIEPEDDRLLEPAGAKRYLEQYFLQDDISIYWGSSSEFLTELSHHFHEVPA